MKNKRRVLLLLTALAHLTIGFAQGNAVRKEGKSLELSQIQVVPITDMKSNRNYELYIELPEGYSENESKVYPVLYYTDALWHLEMLSGASEYLFQDAILVGISWQLDGNEELKKEVGAHLSRFRDYSMTKHSDPKIQEKYQLGEAKAHLDFIRNDVITYVEQNYRTDPNSRTYFGYSLGGEFGAYILLTQPDTFKNYIIGSPSIKNEVDYLKELHTQLGPYESSNRSSSLAANVYVAYGSLEGASVVEPIDEFIKILNDRRDPGLSVIKEVIDGNHTTAFPMTAVRAVSWLASTMTPVANYGDDVSFWSIPQLNTPFISQSPEKRNDGLAVGKLRLSEAKKKAIVQVSQEIFEGDYGNYDALLISHKNELVYESYYRKGRINSLHGQASAVKGYTSLVVGRAIQMGYLSMDDLDKPLIHFLKDLDPSKFAAGAEKITLHKALTMQGGLTIDREKWKDFENDSVRLKGQGLVRTLLEQTAPITNETQTYLYGNFNPMMVMTVVDAVVPGSVEDFIKIELLDKLGITDYEWSKHANGLPQAGWQARFKSRDMLKFGYLVQNKGRHNGEQLISEAYLKKATSNIVRPAIDWMPKNYGYGYFWYHIPVIVDGKSYDMALAWGGGGQRVIVVEELDLTLVIAGFDRDDDKIMNPIFETVVPAFAEDEF